MPIVQHVIFIVLASSSYVQFSLGHLDTRAARAHAHTECRDLVAGLECSRPVIDTHPGVVGSPLANIGLSIPGSLWQIDCGLGC